jgi:Holliday junction resolvase
MGRFQVKMAQRHERELEEQWPEARRTIASGAKFEKGDLVTAEIYNVEFAVECKSTQNSSYGISKKVWGTIREHAQNRSWLARPILAVRLYGPTLEATSWGGERENTPETVPVELDLVVMEKDDWLEFYEEFLRLKEQESK